MRRAHALLPVLLLVAAAAAETLRTEAAGLRFVVPKSWTRVPATSEMRAAQYRVPRAEGDAEDAELVLFFFGPGQGGGVQQNLDRWYGQFEQTDGRPSKDAAKVTTRKLGALGVTTVDLSGTYRPTPMMGGAGAPKPGYRMLAAVVEGEHGPWFFRLTGPQATVGRAKSEFDALGASLEPHR